MLDTPGVMAPHVPTAETGMKLALIGECQVLSGNKVEQDQGMHGLPACLRPNNYVNFDTLN